MTTSRFYGRIAGVGSTSGVRVVVGHWHDTPLGAFSDAMVATGSGHRVLLAPHEAAAGFIASTYRFDEVRIEPFAVAARDGAWRVRSPSLVLDLTVGPRTALGRLLRAVPRRLAGSPAFCTVTDPVARVVLDGVRTRGSAGGGRREFYGATDHRVVTAASGSFDGVDLGSLAPVDPAPRFGFSSTPARPSVTSVVTTVRG
ncbi:hypothetical protein [Nocardioides sp. SYSU DS0663]|uniref:hypothetical protein n=1 Tax=Nocardioides sp. SYSU DS0663 TaxID=3416445 RepID=UPI003F4BD443